MSSGLNVNENIGIDWFSGYLPLYAGGTAPIEGINSGNHIVHGNPSRPKVLNNNPDAGPIVTKDWLF